MSARTSTLSIHSVRRPSRATRLNVAGLVLTAMAMLLQIAAGSTLYPSVTGPVVLVVTAMAVAFVRSRWTRYLGLAVPLVLGIGAIAAAVMTGDFIDQLTSPTNPGVLLGSAMHVIGLTAAIAGGLRMVTDRPSAAQE